MAATYTLAAVWSTLRGGRGLVETALASWH
jgi:hypothetical protein